VRLEWASATDPGRIRVVNQDAWFADGTVFAVADGMGGHVGGEVASEIAIASFQQLHARGGRRSTTQEDDPLNAAIIAANAAILSRSNAEQELRGMGTTLTAAQFVEDHLDSRFEIRSIGDSRAYLFHDGEIHQITDDHTYVQELIKSGSITEEEGRFHRQRHILTRVLGVESSVRVDSFRVRVDAGDLILLCSDGLFNHVLDPTIAAVLGSDRTIQEIADELVIRANDGGGSDNITVVVVRVLDDGQGEGLHRRTGSSVVEVDELPRADVAGGPSISVNPIARGPVLSSIPTHLNAREVNRSGLITTRTIVFFLLLAVIVAGAVGLVDLYASHAYFVGKNQGRVAIYKGRPGGILWFDPVVVERTSLAVDKLNPAQSLQISHDVAEPSLAAARTFVHNLSRVGTSSNSSVTSTSTTVAPSTSTTGAG
jgi:protein phosphatase